MATKTSGASPDHRRTYVVAFKAEALRLASADHEPNQVRQDARRSHLRYRAFDRKEAAL